ncbi:MAG: hypothetical protein NTX47_05500 [Candidatus Omnitrophica bacterium]|nr:hypothetical protein [Candidatus Omnitrophota bacterium]
MLNIPLNRIVKTYTTAAVFAIICFLVISCLVPPAQAKGSKEGVVLHAANKAGFVFTDLGEKEVKVGALVEIYRRSEYLATFVIKDVKPEMSEAWSLSTDKNLAIKIGDRVIVPDVVSAAGASKFISGEHETPSSQREQLLNSKLSDLQNENARLLSEVIELNKQKDSLSANLSSELVNIKKINAQTQRETEQRLLSELASLVKQNEDNSGKLNLELAALTKQKDELESKLFILAKEKQDSDSKLNAQIAGLAKDKENAEAQLNSRIKTLSSQYSFSNKDKESLEQKLANLIKQSEDNSGKLKLELAALTKQKDDSELKLNSQIVTLSNQLQALDKLSKEDENRVRSETATAIQGKEKLISELNNKVAVLEREKSDLNSQIVSLNTEKQENESKLSLQISVLETEKADLGAKLVSLSAEKEDSESNLKYISSLVKYKEDGEQKLYSQISYLSDQLKKSEKAKEDSESQLKAEISSLNKEKEDLKFRLDSDITNLSKAKDDNIAELNKKIALFSDQHAIAEKSKEESEAKLRLEISALANADSKLKEEYELLNKEKKKTEMRLYEEIAAVEKEKSFLESRINILENLKAEYALKTNSFDFEKRTLEDVNNALKLQLKKALALKTAEVKLEETEYSQDLELDKKAAARGLQRETKRSGQAEEGPRAVKKEVGESENKNISSADIPAPEVGSLKIASELMVEKTSGAVIGKDAASRDVWLDFSKANGIVEGQIFDVYRDNIKISALKTTKVFDSFIVTKPLADSDFNVIQELDRVEISSN